MCEWGNDIYCLVLVPADLSHSERPYWKLIGIDSCLAPMVNALNRAGIYTASCCCGHGKQLGHLWLQDGRKFIIMPPEITREEFEKSIEALQGMEKG